MPFCYCQREDYRAIAKLETAPAIFEINEPMIFGLPIVLNPLLVVPFILTPLVTGTFAYFMTKLVLQVYVFMQCHGQPHRF